MNRKRHTVKQPTKKTGTADSPVSTSLPEKLDFARLVKEAAACQTCPRMADQPAVLSPANGNLQAEVVFVAEAPGRFGSGRTGVPFQGDKSGDNFQTLIDHVGLKRESIFITNAVLCNPLTDGKNSRPTAREIRNCSPFLHALLELIQPKLVVTLGGVGLEAVNRLWNTAYRLQDTVGKVIKATPFPLLPLYHPSPRVVHWRRPMPRQKRDYQLILKHLKSRP